MKRKAFALRLDPAVHAAVERLADKAGVALQRVDGDACEDWE